MALRIGFLLPSQFSIGNPGNGIMEQAYNQANALERRGHVVVRLGPWRFCSETEFDVLHFFLGGMHLFGIEINRQLTKPGVLVFSPIIDSNQTNFLYRLAARSGNMIRKLFTIPGILQNQALGSDVVVCRSIHEQERVVKGLGVPRSRTEIVHNGIDFTPCTAQDLQDVKRSLELPDEFVLHVSAYSQERKNALRLIAAIEDLPYPLVLAGHVIPGSILNAIQDKAKRKDKIRLIGFVDQKTRNALYGLCKVYCQPSTHEGTGLAALEAGAAGASVVITKNGGAPDYFASHAIYVNPFDLNDIRQAIEQAWNRAKDNKLMEHIRSNLTWDQSALRLEELYLKYLNIKSQANGDAHV